MCDAAGREFGELCDGFIVMATGTVHIELREALAIVELRSPPLNRIDRAMIDGLRSAVTELERADDVRALLLRGDGEVFSAGADVRVFNGLGTLEAAELARSFMDLAARIEHLPFPTLAAAHGQCVAGGLELALFCDLLWCAQETLVGLPEARLGLMPLAGGVQRLAARAGVGRARAMTYAGALHPAEHVVGWGVVDRVLPPDQLQPEAEAFTTQLAAGPTQSLAAIKRVLLTQRDLSIGAADAALLDEVVDVFASADAQAGIAAYLRGDLADLRFSGF